MLTEISIPGLFSGGSLVVLTEIAQGTDAANVWGMAVGQLLVRVEVRLLTRVLLLPHASPHSSFLSFGFGFGSGRFDPWDGVRRCAAMAGETAGETELWQACDSAVAVLL